MSKREIKTNLNSKRKRATKATVLERYRHLEELLVLGHRRTRILKEMEEKFEVTPATVEKMITEIYKEWGEEEKGDLPKKREAQERRIMHSIRNCWSLRDRARFEMLYARVVGTEAPKKIGLSSDKDSPVKIVLEVTDYRGSVLVDDKSSINNECPPQTTFKKK